MRSLVYGVGINDANYNIGKTCYTAEGKRRIVWICPLYKRWSEMLKRCYSEKLQIKFPTYVGCYTVPEWHYFMTFREWMTKQDWQGKELDKDLLFPGNKVYGPDTCVFIDQKVNKFMTEAKAIRGDLPIGVCFDKNSNKFRAKAWDVSLGRQKHLGMFTDAEEAYKAWLTFKLEKAKILASEQNDPRIAKALIERYENYVRD